jgi:hypothetical protein
VFAKFLELFENSLQQNTVGFTIPTVAYSGDFEFPL